MHDDAIDQKIIRGGGDTLTLLVSLQIFTSWVCKKILILWFFCLSQTMQFLFFKIKLRSNAQQTLASLKKVWSKYFPKDPFDYFFLDESFGQQYKADLLFGKVFGVFAFLAILIACFGLLGLSAYNVLQRTKEIGIRKVLGASLQSILVLLSRDFLKLIVISLLLAVPVGWFIMNRWLQDYAYRITIGWWVFAIAGATALFIAIITICIQVLKAAERNPVKSLRTE